VYGVLVNAEQTVLTTKPAGELAIGDWAVESGGCEWRITDIQPVGTTRVRLTLTNEHRYMSAGPECTQVVSRKTRINVRCSA
jgi:hypothetical protein